MAIEERQEQQDEENGEKKKSSSILKIVIISVTLAVLLGGGLVGGTFYFVSNMKIEQTALSKTDTADAEETEDDEEDDVSENEPVAPPMYHSMDPKFVVSFNNQSQARFMQFSLEIMSRDDDVIKRIEEHMPVVRSSLLMLFGGQGYEQMVTREGKEKLLTDVTTDINTTLKNISGDEEASSAIVEAAYFNSFVIQ